MSRPIGSTTTPSYRLHRASGQAITTIDGQDYYLGPHDTKTSKREYDRLIGEWLANGRQMPVETNSLEILQLINDYRQHAESYYADPGERRSIIRAMRQLNRLYGHTTVGNFGPLALKTVREAMVKLDWSRKHVNAQVGRIVRMFRWGVENER